MKKKKIAIVSGSRAEFGILKNLIINLKKKKKYKLSFIVTGSHLSKKFGETVNEIYQSKIKIDFKIKLTLNDKTDKDTLLNLSIGLQKFANFFSRNKFDLIIILGDRWEIFAAGIASNFFKIPIVHIHGGESTKASIDDSIRHSLTKMSFFHFVSTKKYRQKVINMGESPNRVFNVGALAGDNIKNFKPIKKEILENDLKVKLNDKCFLVTFHPETLSKIPPVKQIKIVISALKKFKDLNFIFTFPNAETGSSSIIKILKKECKENKNFTCFKSLGQFKYFSVMYYCKGLIGNSSSGIIEAPYMHKINFNIGDRQFGRIRTKNTIDVPLSTKKIVVSIKKFYKKKINVTKNPYGNGTAAKKITKILDRIKIPENNQKEFYI